MDKKELIQILKNYNIDINDIGEHVIDEFFNDKYKIGDIARFLDVSVDTLRLYDKKGIVVPHRDSNGYRFYTRNQMIILNYVMHLRKANLSLDNIKTIVNSTNLEKSISLMEYSEMEIDKQLETLNNIKNVIKDYKNVYKKSLENIEHYEILKNTKIVLVNVSDINKHVFPIDYSMINEKYRFVFSFLSDKTHFEKDCKIHDFEKIIKMKYAFSYIIKSDEEIKEFNEEYYNILEAKDYASFIIKCKIPTNYSQIYKIIDMIVDDGYKIIDDIIIRTASLRNGKNQDIDYYEVLVPISQILQKKIK